MPYEYRAYWDRIGHKRNCPVWGDEEMIYSCTCGTPEMTATGRFVSPDRPVIYGAGGGGGYHNPSSVTVGYGGAGSSHIVDAVRYAFAKGTVYLDRDVDYPGIEKRLAKRTGRSGMNRRETIKARMRQLEEELAKIDRFPKDTFANGTVLRFDKLFDLSWGQYWQCEPNERESITVYTYAAVKAGGYWYCSGQPNRAPQRVHWDALIEWMGDGVEKLWLMVPEGDLLDSYSQAEVPAKAVEAAPTPEPLPTTDEDLDRSYKELGD